MTEHPHSQIPLRMSDEELVALGALIRGDQNFDEETKSKAVVIIGVKLTQFFMDVAKVAVEHYDREVEST